MLIVTFSIAALGSDPYTLWHVDSSLSEGEVAWPQEAATAQDAGWGEAPIAAAGGLMPNYGYESEGEVPPGVTSDALSPGRVL